MNLETDKSRNPSGNAAVPLLIGTAGWAIPRSSKQRFDGSSCGQTQLERYAKKLSAVEINSSFYRPHKRTTYERWASATPPAFRFSVKLPRSITHTARLEKTESLLLEFTEQVTGLGPRLGCLLVQLPPSLALDIPTAETFLMTMRSLSGDASIALEPRHASWFTPECNALLSTWRVARVLADPAKASSGGVPGGWPGLIYCRLHGSPREYYSAYESTLIRALAERLAAATSEAKNVWCVFDNTASGAATGNALDLQQLLNTPH